jgi:hypothetical protein
MKLYILFGDKGKEALDYAERKDRYIDRCLQSPANSRARTGTAYLVAHLSESEMNTYTQLFEEYKRHIPQRLLADLDYVSIVILMPSADTGFPHTRPDRLICFPHSASLPSLSTFIHELWHIHQRTYPDIWARFYERVWRFRPSSAEDIPEELYSHIRINPDTLAQRFYCWRDTWVALPIFQSPTQPRLGDTSIWFVNIQTGLWRKSAPAEWIDYFGNNTMLPLSAHEHPNELSAYMLSLFSHDMKGPRAFRDLVTSIGATSFISRHNNE